MGIIKTNNNKKDKMFKAFATLAIATAVSAIHMDAAVLAQTKADPLKKPECRPWKKACKKEWKKYRADLAAAEAAATATCGFLEAAIDDNHRYGWECSDGSMCVNGFDHNGSECDVCTAANGEVSPHGADCMDIVSYVPPPPPPPPVVEDDSGDDCDGTGDGTDAAAAGDETDAAAVGDGGDGSGDGGDGTDAAAAG